MRAHFQLPSITSEEIEGKAPIQVKFEIPYYTTSGLQVGIFYFSEKNTQLTKVYPSVDLI